MKISKKKLKFKFNPIFISKLNNFVIAVILITIGFVFLTAVVIEESEQEMYGSLNEQSATVSIKLNSIIQPTNIVFSYLNRKISADPNISKKKILDLMMPVSSFNDLRHSSFIWSNLIWVDKTDHLILSTTTGILDKPIDVRQKDYVKFPKNQPGSTFISKRFKGDLTGMNLLPLSQGVVDKNNNYIGTMTIGVDYQSLRSFLDEIKDDKEIVVAVTNSKNQIIISNFIEDEAEFHKEVAPPSSINKKPIELEEPIDINGKKFYYAISLPDLDVNIYLGHDEDIIGTNVADTFFQSFMLYIVSLVSVLVLINILHSNLSRAFSRLFQTDFREKMNLIKFSDRARDNLSFDLQRSLQMEIIDNVSINLNKTNINHVISEAILISTKDSLAKNVNLYHKASSYKDEIMCDTLRIKQVLISLLKILISIIPENRSIEITSYNENSKFLIQFAVANIDIGSLDKIMTGTSFHEEGFNSLIYLDFNQIEYFLKLHGGAMILDVEKNEKINFILSIPIEDGSSAPKLKDTKNKIGANIVSLSSHRSKKKPN